MEQTPLYLASEAFAHKQGEEPLYRASLKENINCALYLDKALQKIDSQSGGEEMKRLARRAIQRYGADRVEHVLSASVLLCGPGCFCRQTTDRLQGHAFPEAEWTKGAPDNPVFSYALHHHPCHIDALCGAFMQQRPVEVQAAELTQEM